MSDALIYTVYGFYNTRFSHRWLNTAYFSLRGLSLGKTDRPYVVKRGESIGGKNSLIFLRGDNAGSDINKFNISN